MRPNLEKNHGGRDRLIKRVEVKSFSYDPEDAANIPLAASNFYIPSSHLSWLNYQNRPLALVS